MRALVVADGDPTTRASLDAAWPDWDAGVAFVVAADGGARLADALGLTIDRWVGDGDSLGPEGLAALRERGVSIELALIEKDQSDTELGLEAAAASGATSIVILGALGGPRPDHALANVALLGRSDMLDRAVEILDPRARIRLLAADAALKDGAVSRIDVSGRVGDLVSLIPLTDTSGVSTMGLRYALDEATLSVGRSRTVSNVRTQPSADVAIRSGRVLVIEAPATFSA